MSSFYREQLEDWLSEIDVNASAVLDVGGSDNPIKGRTRTWNTSIYRIVDLENPHKGEKPDWILDLNTGEMKVDISENPFFPDVIFCLEVFEYIWNPVVALKCINKMLDNGGLLYISFPFVYPVHEPAESDYLRYTKFGVQKLLEETGFEIIDNKSRIATEGGSELISFYSKERMRYKGALRTNTIQDIGYLVTARKK